MSHFTKRLHRIALESHCRRANSDHTSSSANSPETAHTSLFFLRGGGAPWCDPEEASTCLHLHGHCRDPGSRMVENIRKHMPGLSRIKATGRGLARQISDSERPLMSQTRIWMAPTDEGNGDKQCQRFKMLRNKALNTYH